MHRLVRVYGGIRAPREQVPEIHNQYKHAFLVRIFHCHLCQSDEFHEEVLNLPNTSPIHPMHPPRPQSLNNPGDLLQQLHILLRNGVKRAENYVAEDSQTGEYGVEDKEPSAELETTTSVTARSPTHQKSPQLNTSAAAARFSIVARLACRASAWLEVTLAALSPSPDAQGQRPLAVWNSARRK